MRLTGVLSYSARAVGILVVIFIAGAFGHFFVLEPTEVKGRSMEGTLHNEDTIAIEKVSLLFDAPERGQVISLFDKRGHMLLVKRVVGLPGEQVVIENGRVFIITTDGEKQELDEPYLKDETITLPAAGESAVYPVIPEFEYFVLGDNRTRSTDSRVYGPVHRSDIVGVVRQPFAKQ